MLRSGSSALDAGNPVISIVCAERIVGILGEKCSLCVKLTKVEKGL